MNEKRYTIQCGAIPVDMTTLEIRQTFINCGEILLEKEKEMQEIFDRKEKADTVADK